MLFILIKHYMYEMVLFVYTSDGVIAYCLSSRWSPSKGGSRNKDCCMLRYSFALIRSFSNYLTLHRSDLTTLAAPLGPPLPKLW